MTANTPSLRGSFLGGLIALVLALPLMTAQAATGPEIDARVNAAIDRLHKEVKGSSAVTTKSAGYLVFPGVIRAGFVFAGEGGEGALRIGGKTAGYYNMISGSVGFQGGAQKRDIIIVFMDAASLKKFQASDGWKAGADASVAVWDVGAGANIDVSKIKEPVIAFVVGQSGLMAGVSIDGSKITKTNK
jgi:lipid-binding SYLF domain-containing protein